jgi:hypothetical protein
MWVHSRGASNRAPPIDVRFTPKSGHRLAQLPNIGEFIAAKRYTK